MRIIVLVGVLGIATPALAEPTREGFLIGVSFGGGGSNSCRDCVAGPGAAGELHLGWWINRNFAVGYEGWAFVGDTNTLTQYSVGGFGLFTATFRVAPRWWVKGGAGLAMYQEAHPLVDELTGMKTDVDYKGLGLGGAVGYELYQSRGSFVVEASGRLGVSLFPDHGGGAAGSVGIGIGWN